MTIGIGNTPRIAPRTQVGNVQRNPAQRPACTARGCGHSTQDSFTPSQPAQQAQQAQQAQSAEKKNMLKQLLEQLMPMIQQMLGALGQQQPQAQTQQQ